MLTQKTDLIKSADFISGLSLMGSKGATKSAEDTSFETIFNNSTNAETASDKAIVSNTKDTSRNTQVDSNVSQSYATEKTSSANASETNSSVENEDLKDAADSTSQNEKVGNLLEDVKEVIKDTLNISEEELLNCMEELGLTMMDLLNPAALQQLVLAGNGNQDIMQLITDEGLSNTFASLLESVQNLIQESGLSEETIGQVLNSESFADYLEQVKQTSQEEVTAAAVETSKEDLSAFNQTNDDNVLTKANEIANSNETGKETTSETKEISLTVEKDTDSSSQNSTSADSQSSMENQADGVVNVNELLEHITTNVTKIEESFSGQLSQITTIREIANQIVEQIKIVIKPTQTSMEMQLNPENLGKVALTISSKEGVMTAQFTAQNAVAKEAIESQMQVLKQNLENQGIKVEAIEVTVSDFAFSQKGEAGSDNNSGEGKQKRAFVYDTEDDEDSFENNRELASGLIDDTISNVDYTA